MTSPIPHPDPFLTVRVDSDESPLPLSAACVGYEMHVWRSHRLSRHVLEWLPEFALTYSEWRGLSHHDAVLKVAEAARAVYQSEKYGRRGEFGEILLHILLRQHAGSVPAISKIYFKDAANDTVKGFDAVHVVDNGDLELWLGEVKFYSDIASAIRDVIAELSQHTAADYLRSEFIAITNKLDGDWEHADTVKDMLSRNRSLDEIFSAVCIPVLLTYNSDAVRSYDEVTAEYIAAFETEVAQHWESFCDRLPDLPVRVHLFLLPLEDKADLIEKMDEALRHAQAML